MIQRNAPAKDRYIHNNPVRAGWLMKHGIINIAAQQTIVHTSTDYYDWSIFNNTAGHSPAIIFDLSHPSEDLNQGGVG
jgi:hypothetical protein